uniref:Uncharacterized protein n=1 Tax=Fusarium oxysporum (strain Fo5176) TaxID=660025 RepID=A0A0D2YI60_FUSOF
MSVRMSCALPAQASGPYRIAQPLRKEHTQVSPVIHKAKAMQLLTANDDLAQLTGGRPLDDISKMPSDDRRAVLLQIAGSCRLCHLAAILYCDLTLSRKESLHTPRLVRAWIAALVCHGNHDFHKLIMGTTRAKVQSLRAKTTLRTIPAMAQTQTRQTIKDILRMGLLTIAPFDGSPM